MPVCVVKYYFLHLPASSKAINIIEKLTILGWLKPMWSEWPVLRFPRPLISM